MIHPSYSELIEAINTNNEDDDEALVLNSRYSLVLAASKRARQLIAGAEPLVPGASRASFSASRASSSSSSSCPGRK